ncbi:MAG: hypothetical protein AAF715_07415 [Myxococcota bacterium]
MVRTSRGRCAFVPRETGGDRERSRAAAGMLVAALAILTPASALAQSAADSAIAEALFQDGRALMKAGKAAEACPKFAQSYRVEPKVGTLLNLAGCYEEVGRTASAWSAYTEAAASARRQGQTGRAGYATERAAALKEVLTRLVIRHEGTTPGLMVRLGDQTLAAATLGTPLPVDPGAVRLRAAAEGKQPWSTTVEAPPGPAQIEVVIPPLRDATPVPPAPPDAARSAPSSPVPPSSGPSPSGPSGEAEATSSSIHPLVWVGAAVTGAAVIAGGVTGGLALSRGGSLDCPNNACPPEAADDLDEAQTLATASNVSFGIAGAGAAVLIAGLVLTFPLATTEDPGAIQARVGPAWLGLQGTF